MYDGTRCLDDVSYWSVPGSYLNVGANFIVPSSNSLKASPEIMMTLFFQNYGRIYVSDRSKFKGI